MFTFEGIVGLGNTIIQFWIKNSYQKYENYVKINDRLWKS